MSQIAFLFIGYEFLGYKVIMLLFERAMFKRYNSNFA